jgi:phosphate transport system permease protein
MADGDPSTGAALLEELPPDRREPVPGVREALDRRRDRPGGLIYAGIRWAGAGLFAAVLLALALVLLAGARQGLAHSGIRFLWSTRWDTDHDVYGAGVFVAGTAVTTGVALLLAVPVGLAAAAFLAELAPPRLARTLAMLIDLIAAVPSIVVGLWGLLVLTPVFARQVEPFLARLPLAGGLFAGPALGSSLLLAAAVLAVMIVPTVVSLARTALQGVAAADREAALALGATRWQVMCRAVIPGARTGIEAGVTLATGRALGEAIAVAMVVGNRYALPRHLGTVLLSPGATLGSAVINSFSEATTSLQRSEVIGLMVYLLALSVAVNAGGQLLLRRRRRRRALRSAAAVGAP